MSVPVSFDKEVFDWITKSTTLSPQEKADVLGRSLNALAKKSEIYKGSFRGGSFKKGVKTATAQDPAATQRDAKQLMEQIESVIQSLPLESGATQHSSAVSEASSSDANQH